MLIVTNKPKEIADAIYAVSQHGATILDGEGSYEHCERQIVYSVVSAAQTKKVIHAVKEADPKAFINEVKHKTIRKILSSKRKLIQKRTEKGPLFIKKILFNPCTLRKI